MNVDEFLTWMETEPDSYELVDGEPVRMPNEKQGGRRIGNLWRAADLALNEYDRGDWLCTPLPELRGVMPYMYAALSWRHLAAVLQLLRDPEDGRKLVGDNFGDIKNRAERLARIERQRRMHYG